METTESRGNFTGRIGFIMAAAGSAVGLGNIWRFPYLADTYGGGAFLVTYLILSLVVGLILMVTELAIGRYTGKSCIDAFQDLCAKYKVIGWLGLIIPMIIVPYYCVIGGWVAKYFFEYGIGMGSTAGSDGFFTSFTSGGLPGIADSPVLWFIIFVALTMAVVVFGVEKGVERVSKILMPALLILLIGICCYTLTLDGIGEGLKHYIIPQMKDFSMETALAAMGQVFYSLSLAMGIMITYGSYMKKDVHIPGSARIICIMDMLVAFLAGLVVIPATMVFSDGVGEGGPGLMFMIMPQVFEAMPAGHIIAVAFFLLVVFAALTSAISLSETVVSVFKDRLKLTRINACILCTVIMLALGMLSCLGFGVLGDIKPLGKDFLTFFDDISNKILMPIFALLICIFVGHVISTKVLTDEIGFEKSKYGIDYVSIYTFMVKWICPICILIVFALGILGFLGIYSL